MTVRSGEPEVLYLYGDGSRRCLMRCWRKLATPVQMASVNAQTGSSSSAQTGSSSGAGGDGGDRASSASSGSSSPRKRRQQGGSAASKRQTASEGSEASRGVPDGGIASAVDQWARGKDLRAMLCALQPFAHVLGEVPPTAARADLMPEGKMRTAYRRACLQLHPDRHVASSPRTRTIAEELFKVLSAAYVDHQCASQLCSPTMAC